MKIPLEASPLANALTARFSIKFAKHFRKQESIVSFTSTKNPLLDHFTYFHFQLNCSSKIISKLFQMQHYKTSFVIAGCFFLISPTFNFPELFPHNFPMFSFSEKDPRGVESCLNWRSGILSTNYKRNSMG